MSWAIRSTLLILTRREAAALLTISSDTTNSGNAGGCLLDKDKVFINIVDANNNYKQEKHITFQREFDHTCS